MADNKPVKTIARVLALLTDNNMVLHAPIGRTAEITILLDDGVEYETTADIYAEILSGVKASDEKYKQLIHVRLQEPQTAATWCIVAAANTEALKYEVQEEKEDDEEEEWGEDGEEDIVKEDEEVPLLSPLEILEAIAKFQIEIDWEIGDPEDEDEWDDCNVSAFPNATGGTWTHVYFKIRSKETFEDDKMEALKKVVSKLVQKQKA